MKCSFKSRTVLLVVLSDFSKKEYRLIKLFPGETKTLINIILKLIITLNLHILNILVYTMLEIGPSNQTKASKWFCSFVTCHTWHMSTVNPRQALLAPLERPFAHKYQLDFVYFLL